MTATISRSTIPIKEELEFFEFGRQTPDDFPEGGKGGKSTVTVQRAEKGEEGKTQILCAVFFYLGGFFWEERGWGCFHLVVLLHLLLLHHLLLLLLLLLLSVVVPGTEVQKSSVIATIEIVSPPKNSPFLKFYTGKKSYC